MTASSVGFRPMRKLDFKHNAEDVELMRNIAETYYPKIYFEDGKPIYTDGHSIYGYVAQRFSNGELATSDDGSVIAFTRIPIPE